MSSKDTENNRFNITSLTIAAISSRAAGSAAIQYSLHKLLSSSHRANAARHRIRPAEDNHMKHFQKLIKQQDPQQFESLKHDKEESGKPKTYLKKEPKKE